MRKATVHRNGELVGTLIEENQEYIFRYDDAWFANDSMPAVSLTLPKNQQEFRNAFLFPFFYNMLSEGANKKLQNTQLRIDEEDSFGLLLATAQCDTIGAITIIPVDN